MSHIFISYSTQNSSYAIRLAHKLREEGFDVWIDNSRLRSSENWWEKIVNALGNCAAVVVVMTPEARQSRWVQREVTLADNWRKPTFPMLLSGENWEIFVLTQYEDIRGGDLPPPEFYDDLSQVAPRQTRRGVDVTDTAFEAAVDDTQMRREIREEIANPPPTEPEALDLLSKGSPPNADTVEETPPPQPNFSPVAVAPIETAAPKRRPLWKSGYAVIGAVIVLAVAVSLLLLRASSGQRGSSGAATPTPTPTPTPSMTMTPLGAVIQPSAIWTFTPFPTAISSLGEIAYASNRDGNFDIYLMNADGSNARRLIDTGEDDHYPTWSPDGQRIAFISGRSIYIMNADGSSAQPIAFSNNYFNRMYDLEWSPGGAYLAFTGDYTIYTVWVGGGQASARELTTRSENRYEPDLDASWSPDGEQLAFASARSFEYQLYVMDKQGNVLRQQTTYGAANVDVVWNPVYNNTLAFASNRDGDFDIYTMNATFERDIRKLTDNQVYDGDPVFSRDGQQIVFVSERDGNKEIYLMQNYYGAVQTRLTYSDGIDLDPAWRPSGD